MQETTPMDEDGKKVSEIKSMIMQGEYRVEPVVVADALLRRLRDLAAARAEHVRSDERAWATSVRLNARTPRAPLAYP
jgi:hypothetical protein